jgi:putative FmdB family regulatory protein
MPTYVYGCDACGNRFEKFQKFSDEPVRICPNCQSAVRRIVQPAGIVFKGSGWHTTDYKRNGGDAAANGGEAKTDSGKSEATTDAKSETKTAEPASTPSAADTTKPAQAA